MRVVVAGGSGFLGTPLRRELAEAGHEVTQLVRRPAAGPDQLQWDPSGPVVLPEDTGAVVNLCGATIGHRWTRSYKQLIRSSRIVPTTRLAQVVARQSIPVMISSSGLHPAICASRAATRALSLRRVFRMYQEPW